MQFKCQDYLNPFATRVPCLLVLLVQFVHVGLEGGWNAKPVGLLWGLCAVGTWLRRNVFDVRVVPQFADVKNATIEALIIFLIILFIGASISQWCKFMWQKTKRGIRFPGFETFISALSAGAKCSTRTRGERHRGNLQHHHPVLILQRNSHEPKLHRQHYAIRHSIKMMVFLLVCCFSTGAAMNDKDDAESISSSEAFSSDVPLRDSELLIPCPHPLEIQHDVQQFARAHR